MTFALHPQLAKDTTLVGDLPLCRLLLSKDGNYPWFILVPRLVDTTEFHQLTDEQQAQYLIESNAVSLFLKENIGADKINIAALGNMVPQLHIHHVARFKDDIAWPNPIWGFTAATIRADAVHTQLINDVKSSLQSLLIN